MMSASEVEGYMENRMFSKGGCDNLIVKICSKYGQGGGGKKSNIFVDIITGSSLTLVGPGKTVTQTDCH